MSQIKSTASNSNRKSTAELFKKLDKQPKAQGLDSGLLLIAKQSPAMADIMSRMIDAELSSVKNS